MEIIYVLAKCNLVRRISAKIKERYLIKNLKFTFFSMIFALIAIHTLLRLPICVQNANKKSALKLFNNGLKSSK